jgi:hypothetical protein
VTADGCALPRGDGGHLMALLPLKCISGRRSPGWGTLADAGYRSDARCLRVQSAWWPIRDGFRTFVVLAPSGSGACVLFASVVGARVQATGRPPEGPASTPPQGLPRFSRSKMRCPRAAAPARGLRAVWVSRSQARSRPTGARGAFDRRDLITQPVPSARQIAASVVFMVSPLADASVLRECRSSDLTSHPGPVDPWCIGDGDGMETAAPMGRDSAGDPCPPRRSAPRLSTGAGRGRLIADGQKDARSIGMRLSPMEIP